MRFRSLSPPERIAAQKRNQLVGVGRLFTGVLSGGLLLGLVPRSLYKDVPPAEYTFGGSATDRLQQLLTEPECFARPGETCDEGTLATSVYPYDPSAFRKDELQLHLVHRQGEGGWMSSCRITEVLRLPLAAGRPCPSRWRRCSPTARGPSQSCVSRASSTDWCWQAAGPTAAPSSGANSQTS